MTLAWNARTAPDLFIFQMNLIFKINQLSSIITLMISRFNRCDEKKYFSRKESIHIFRKYFFATYKKQMDYFCVQEFQVVNS